MDGRANAPEVCGDLLRHCSFDRFLLAEHGVRWVGHNVLSLEVLDQLVRHLAQHFLRQQIGVSGEVPEWHKLHNVSGLVSAGSLRIQRVGIGIQGIHVIELEVANANDDYGQRQAGSSHNLVRGRRHVRDGSICENQQNGVLLLILITLRHLLRTISIDIAQKLSKVRWAIELTLSNCTPVDPEDTFNSGNFWIGNVAVEREAVGSSLIAGEPGSKTVNRVLLIFVIMLQNVPDGLCSLDVLV